MTAPYWGGQSTGGARMEIAKIKVNGTQAIVAGRSLEPVTSGTVGAEVTFSFSEEWEELHKTAVFRAGAIIRDAEDVDEKPVRVPPEVLERSGVRLFVGVCGRDAAGTLVIPTVYAEIGMIAMGADPSGEAGREPGLPVWQVLREQIGSLDTLETEAKENLVAAINEALKNGAVSPETLADAIAAYFAEHPPEETDPTVPDWAKQPEKPGYTASEVGALAADTLPAAINTALQQAKQSGAFDGPPGKDGAPGADGQPGRDGADGAPGTPGYTPQKEVDYFDGAPGKSAYQLAVENGYEGTEAEWLESLHEHDAALPPVAEEDNGKVLGVVGGAWGLMEHAAGGSGGAYIDTVYMDVTTTEEVSEIICGDVTGEQLYELQRADILVAKAFLTRPAEQEGRGNLLLSFGMRGVYVSAIDLISSANAPIGNLVPSTNAYHEITKQEKVIFLSPYGILEEGTYKASVAVNSYKNVDAQYGGGDLKVIACDTFLRQQLLDKFKLYIHASTSTAFGVGSRFIIMSRRFVK